MTVPERLKGALPRGYKGDALRRERDALIMSMSRSATQTELARQFCLSTASVHYLLKDAKGTPRRGKTLLHVIKSSGKQTGTMLETLGREPADFVNWLLGETPEGSTICQTLVAIARDAFAETNEQ